MLSVIQWVFKPETVLMFLKLKQTEILKKKGVRNLLQFSCLFIFFF